MSCPPEWRVAAYVDAGLDAAEARRVEAHLVGCESCRGRVLALREENGVLAAVLAGADAAPVRAPGRAAPARGFALGLPLAVGVTALVTVVVTGLFEMRPPSGLGWLHPLEILGVNDMLFDTIFLLRDRAPGWLELAAALGALGGLAAVATFLAGALLRRYSGSAALVCAVAIGLAGADAARAAPRFTRQETLRIARGEVHQGTLAVSCESLEVEGIVVGDVLAFCERVEIRGEVEGNVVAVGREIELRGRVAGTLVAAGERVTLEGSVGANGYLGGERVSLGPDARIARDAFLAGKRVRMEGEVARDAALGGERVELEGEVGRDVALWGERVILLSGTRVGGDLVAHLPAADRLERAEGAVVAGASDVEVLDRHGHGVWSRYREGRFYTWVAIGFVASFGIGLLLHALVPSGFAGRIETGREFLASLGLGVAFAVLGPLALVLLALTIVGLPAALIGLAAWAICLYLGAIVVAALIGRALLRPEGDSPREFGVALAVGLAVVVLLENLPFVGRPTGWVIALVGTGLLLAQAHAAWRHSRRRAA